MLFFFKIGPLSCLVSGLRSKCGSAKALLGERAHGSRESSKMLLLWFLMQHCLFFSFAI